MAKRKSAHAYELELRNMIKSRTGADCEAWLTPQIRATAMNMVILDKLQDELAGMNSFTWLSPGSMGQQKNEVSPLLPHYDKMQRTMLMQFQSLGLNYSATPRKMTESTKKGVDENDPLLRYYLGTYKI